MNLYTLHLDLTTANIFSCQLDWLFAVSFFADRLPPPLTSKPGRSRDSALRSHFCLDSLPHQVSASQTSCGERPSDMFSPSQTSWNKIKMNEQKWSNAWRSQRCQIAHSELLAEHAWQTGNRVHGPSPASWPLKQHFSSLFHPIS